MRHEGSVREVTKKPTPSRLRFPGDSDLVRFRDGSTPTRDLPRGVTLHDEESAPRRVRDCFAKASLPQDDDHPTHYLVIGKDADSGRPLRIAREWTRVAARGRIAVHLERGAKAEIRAIATDEDGTLVDDAWDFFLEEASSLTFSSLSVYAENSMARTRRRAHVGAEAVLALHTGALGQENAHQENVITLVGKEAQASVRGVVFSAENQETVMKTAMVHEAPATESLIEHYGVAADKSFLAFESASRIDKGMKKSSARQKNRGVVLGRNARLDANPLLYIDEYDVEAAHGAAIGRIDEEELYYLMSRGLTEREAQMLIIRGFLTPLARIEKEEGIEEAVRTLVKERIG